MSRFRRTTTAEGIAAAAAFSPSSDRRAVAGRLAVGVAATSVLVAASLTPRANAADELDLYYVADIALDETRGQAVIIGSGDRAQVAFADLAGQITATLRLGAEPRDVELTADRAYIGTEFGDSGVMVLDLDSATIIDEWTAGFEACYGDLAIANGRLWILECMTDPARIASFDLETGQYQQTDITIDGEVDPLLAAHGSTLVVADPFGERLYAVDVDSTPSLVSSTNPRVGMIDSVVVSPDEQFVFVTGDTYSGVAAFSLPSLTPASGLDQDWYGPHTATSATGGTSYLAVVEEGLSIYEAGSVAPMRSQPLETFAEAMAFSAPLNLVYLVVRASNSDVMQTLVIDDVLTATARLTATMSPNPPMIDRVNTISGRLTDSDGAALAGRTVRATEWTGRYVYDPRTAQVEATTRADGSFSMPIVPKGQSSTGRPTSSYLLEFPGDAQAAGVSMTIDLDDFVEPTTNGVIPWPLGSDPLRVALEISRIRFPDRSAAHAVVARGDDFADSLAGTPLLRDGPLLHTISGSLQSDAIDELRRTLIDGATVYVLGGVNAVPDDVLDQIRAAGFEPMRLAGSSRIETSVAIAEEVLRLTSNESGVAFIARAWGDAGNPTAAWADSVTGGGVAAMSMSPMFVTTTDGLHPAVGDALARHGFADVHLLGGTSALSSQVEAEVARLTSNAQRLAGPDRAATAVEIARTFRGFGGHHLFVNAYREDGWRAGLAAAGLSADFGAPVLVSGQDFVPQPTYDWLRGCRGTLSPSGIHVVGVGMLIDQTVGAQLDGTPPGSFYDC